MLRWLPAPILLVVAVAASAVALADDGPDLAVHDGRTAAGSSTPILSLRRQLDPLVERAADRRLVERLDAFVAAQPPDTCLVVRAGDVVYEHRGDDPQVPASLQKLLTAVATLAELGTDARLGTELLVATVPVAGVVEGDLVVRGAGDPLLATAEYAARYRNQPQLFTDVAGLAAAVVEAGITEIRGAVVGDETRYDAVRYHPSWPSRFVVQGQTGPLSALTVNDGFESFPASGDAPVEPAPDPAALAAAHVDAALLAAGVRVVGEPRSGAAPPDAVALATVPSPPVEEVVGQMLRESDNQTAELLLKELGLRRYGEGSFDAGRTAVNDVLAEVGFDPAAVSAADGSGLSEENTMTCRAAVDAIDGAPAAGAVVAGLAVAGVDGTLAQRWSGTDLVGRLRAKTGSLNEVTGLAGLAHAAGGDVRFALIVNVEPPQRVTAEQVAAQEQLARILVAHPEPSDVAALAPSP